MPAALNAAYISTNSQAKIISANINDVVVNGLRSPFDSHLNYNIPPGIWFSNIQGFDSPKRAIYSIRYYNRHLTDDEILYNQRVDNIRFNLGLNLNGSIQPYTPGRGLTMSRDLAFDEDLPLESFDESLSTEEEECVNVTER